MSSNANATIPLSKSALLLFTSGAITAATFAYYYWTTCHRRHWRTVPPTEWRPVATVAILNVYPLKSGRRVDVQQADCTDVGLQTINVKNDSVFKLRDRSFIVYDEKDCQLKTARTFPTMVLMEMTAVNAVQVSINAPGMDTLFVTIPELCDEEDAREVSVVSHQSERIWGLDCGDEASKWISKYLYNKSSGARLAYHDASTNHRRNIQTVYKKQINVFPKLSNKSTGMFSDLSSYHLINQASVDDLNSRCSEAITVYNFRSPIVISGAEAPAYIEDTWDYIRIGDDAVFCTVQPCTRCAMTTIHPEKGERLPNREPLRTLDKYRKLTDPRQREVDPSPVMGQYLELVKPGVIKVGDAVFVGK